MSDTASASTTSDSVLLAQVHEIVSEYGGTATDLGPDSVGVQGDARFYGPCVYISLPSGMSHDRIAYISNRITNEVRGISRVLLNIT